MIITKVIPKWIQHEPKVIINWPQSGPKVIPKWTQTDPKAMPTWSQSDTKVTQRDWKWFQDSIINFISMRFGMPFPIPASQNSQSAGYIRWSESWVIRRGGCDGQRQGIQEASCSKDQFLNWCVGVARTYFGDKGRRGWGRRPEFASSPLRWRRSG